MTVKDSTQLALAEFLERVYFTYAYKQGIRRLVPQKNIALTNVFSYNTGNVINSFVSAAESGLGRC